MGKRGPPPEPTALRLLKGNLGKRPINHEEPELPPPASATPPQPLTGAALKEWRRLHDVLSQKGVLTEGDAMAFWTYCYLTGEVAELTKKIKKLGLAEAQRLGYVNLQTSRLQLLMRAAGELGLTPSARSRVRVVKDPGTLSQAVQSRRNRFFGGGAPS